MRFPWQQCKEYGLVDSRTSVVYIDHSCRREVPENRHYTKVSNHRRESDNGPPTGTVKCLTAVPRVLDTRLCDVTPAVCAFTFLQVSFSCLSVHCPSTGL